MQARGYLDNRLKYCWPKCICCRYLLYMSTTWT